MKKIEDHNTLVFVADIRANKPQIKSAFKKLYEADVAKINTLVRPDGEKKAYIKLTPDFDAMDIANKVKFEIFFNFLSSYFILFLDKHLLNNFIYLW